MTEGNLDHSSSLNIEDFQHRVTAQVARTALAVSATQTVAQPQQDALEGVFHVFDVSNGRRCCGPRGGKDEGRAGVQPHSCFTDSSKSLQFGCCTESETKFKVDKRKTKGNTWNDREVTKFCFGETATWEKEAKPLSGMIFSSNVKGALVVSSQLATNRSYGSSLNR